MKRLAVLMVAGMAAVQAMGAAFQSKQVSESAQWVVHADVDLLKQTQVGGFLMGCLNSGDMSNKVSALAAILQFDPRKDLNSITLYGKSREPADAVAIFAGAFNESQLVTLLKANDTYEAVAHGRQTIHSWVDEKKPAQGRQYGAAHSGRILIGKGLPMVKEALDVLNGTQAPLDAAATFGAELPVQEPFFMAGTDIPGMGGQPEAQLLSQTKSGRMAAGEKNGSLTLSVSLVAADATVAEKLHSIAQGLLAMGQLRQEQDPKLAALLQSVKIALDGSQVKLDMACPAEQVIGVMREKMKFLTPAR